MSIFGLFFCASSINSRVDYTHKRNEKSAYCVGMGARQMSSGEGAPCSQLYLTVKVFKGYIYLFYIFLLGSFVHLFTLSRSFSPPVTLSFFLCTIGYHSSSSSLVTPLKSAFSSLVKLSPEAHTVVWPPCQSPNTLRYKTLSVRCQCFTLQVITVESVWTVWKSVSKKKPTTTKKCATGAVVVQTSVQRRHVCTEVRVSSAVAGINCTRRICLIKTYRSLS